MNEVYAHAVLGQHDQVVRYYSAWAENDHMYIQNEYCNGTSNCLLYCKIVVFFHKLYKMYYKRDVTF